MFLSVRRSILLASLLALEIARAFPGYLNSENCGSHIFQTYQTVIGHLKCGFL